MLDHPLVFFYVVSLIAGCTVSATFGERDNRVVMTILAFKWFAIYGSTLLSSSLDYGVPVLPYLCIDTIASVYLIRHLMREWQIPVIRLSLLQIVTHIGFFVSVSFMGVAADNRPYIDFILFLSYLQVLVAGRSSLNHGWHRWINPKMARHPYLAVFSILNMVANIKTRKR